MKGSLKHLDVETLQDMLDNLKSDLRLLEMAAGALPQPLIPEYKSAIFDVEHELGTRTMPDATTAREIDKRRPSWETICAVAREIEMRQPPTKTNFFDYVQRTPEQ